MCRRADVARRGRDVDVAERAADANVGRLRPSLQVGACRALDAARDASAGRAGCRGSTTSRLAGTSTRISCRSPLPRSSTRAASTSCWDSASCAINSTSTRPSSVGSISISAGRELDVEPHRARDFEALLHGGLLTPAVAGQALAGEWVGPRDSVARAIARTSHALVEMPSRAAAFSAAAFTDSGRRRLIRAESSSPAEPDVGRGVVDEDELRLLAGEANLDVAGGELGRDLERRLRQQVEDPQPEAGAEDVPSRWAICAARSSPRSATACRSSRSPSITIVRFMVTSL